MTRETKSESGDFLSRWSERKAAARRGETPPEIVQPTESPEKPADPAPQTETSRSPKTVAPPELPPLESLDENSDYSVFFAEGVSDAIRQAALRKLFRTASFNVTDGLDDYAEDFRTFKPLGDVITHEMKRMAELQEKRRRAEQEARRTESERPPEGSEEAATTAGDGQPDVEPTHAALTEEPVEDLADQPDSGDDERHT